MASYSMLKIVLYCVEFQKRTKFLDFQGLKLKGLRRLWADGFCSIFIFTLTAFARRFYQEQLHKVSE